jgi:enoyl-CoA hydratase/carnithine racemase
VQDLASGKRAFYQLAEAESLKSAYQLESAAMLESLQTKDAQQGIECFVQKRGDVDWKHE